uniref:ARAD1B01276p n=1 Tax=Blastobotrys adeninivorans TaxID=409370 RepID=A0A060T489_BLAAD
MSKVLAVIGATGNQGGSVIRRVLKDLPGKIKVRAIVRDPAKPAAAQLASLGCEVVKGDSSDPQGLEQSLKGADYLFFMTMLVPKAGVEFAQGKAIVDAAVGAGVGYLIFSSLPSSKGFSGGKYPVPHMDDKADIEKYVRSLNVKSSFVLPGFFFQNFLTTMRPKSQGDGTYQFVNCISGDVKIPMNDIEHEMGNYVTAILANPDKLEGKSSLAVGGMYSLNDAADAMTKATGKKVVYKQLPENEYLPNLPEDMRQEMILMFKFYEEFEFMGPQTQDLIEQGQTVPMSKPHTFEEFFADHPLDLE